MQLVNNQTDINSKVILVNNVDLQIGTSEKMEAHEKGLLHRAFSIFIFNQRGEMLLQKRAIEKYHSGGLWTNACCSHPFPGENTETAAHRRLREELGFDCELQKLYEFTYRAELLGGLTEHEFDHVFTGQFDGCINFNKDEMSEWRFSNLESITNEVKAYPENFTAWFKIAFPQVVNLTKKT